MHPIPCFRAPLTPGYGVQGRNYFTNLSAIKIYTYAKFHPDWSDGLDFYKVRIYIFCALYIRQSKLPFELFEIKYTFLKLKSFFIDLKQTSLRKEIDCMKKMFKQERLLFFLFSNLLNFGKLQRFIGVENFLRHSKMAKLTKGGSSFSPKFQVRLIQSVNVLKHFFS